MDKDNYLLQRSEAEHTRGFTWLVRTGTAPRPVVLDLAALHGSRSRVVDGELPGALDPVFAARSAETDAPKTVAVPADPERTGRHVAAWAARQGPVLCGLALADLAVAAGDPESALALVEGLDRSIARASVRDRATLDNARASLLLRLGRLDLAQGASDRELATWAMLGDEPGRARAMDFAARVHEAKGDLARARELFAGSLAIKERTGDRAGMCRSLAGLATVHRRTGQVADALATNGRILALKVELGDERGRALCLAAMAGLHEQRGDAARSIALHTEARAIFARLGDEHGEAGALAGLAAAHRGEGQLEIACELSGRAIAIRVRLGDVRGAAAARLGLASALGALGRHADARPHAEEALAGFESAGDLRGAAMAHNALGELERDAGNPAQACSSFEASLALKRNLGDERGRAISLVGLAKATRLAKGDLALARDMLREALAIALAVGDLRGAASARAELATPPEPDPGAAGSGRPLRV